VSRRILALRLTLAAAIVGLSLVILWQAGLLSGGGSGAADVKAPPGLRPADTSLETPSQLNFKVGLAPGNLAPDFEFSDYRGGRARLSDFRGQPVVLNFWASWCGPCKAELPAMSAMLRAYEGRLAMIGVNNGESFATGKRFLDSVHADLTAFAFDPDQAVARRYGLQGLPTSFFIDAQGVITRVVPGALTPGILQSGIEEALIGWGRVQAPPLR
jgi:cytochrome c biogenesis protein CcmG/thiol:disulfide interchange protein DsbE